MEENKYYLYRHIRLDSGVPFYIGIGTKPDKYNSFNSEYIRAFSKQSRNTYWKNIVSKYGYKVEILFETNDKDLIFQKESEFINLYGRVDLGKGTLVNMTDGGEGSFNMSLETREIIRQKNLGRGFSEESLKKMSKSKKEARTGIKYDYLTFKGRKHSEEAKKKVSEKKRQLFNDPEYKKRFVENHNLKNGTKVIDLETGILFDSLKIACDSLNVDYFTARSRLQRNAKNSRFVHLEISKLKNFSSKGTKNELMSVIDLQTGIMFDSLADACNCTNYKYSTANQALRRNSKNIRFVRVYDKEINDNQN